MSRAVSNFNYDTEAILMYFLPVLEMEDKEGLFKYSEDEWRTAIILLMEAFKAFAESDGKFDIKLMMKELSGKIPYKGRRKNIEEQGGKLIFSLLNEMISDYMFNLKIDPMRKKIILKTSKKFKNAVIRYLKKK